MQQRYKKDNSNSTTLALIYWYDKMKNKKYHTGGTVLNSNIKIAERGKLDTPSTQPHDRSLSLQGTETLIKRGVVKLIKLFFA